MISNNFCFYLQNRLIQTNQTGGQQYSDISRFSIPWFQPSLTSVAECSTVAKKKVYLINPTLLFQLFFTVALALVVSRKQDPATHNVTLVASGSEGRPDPGTHEHLSVVGMVGYRTFVPT
jgi:hypothetical protein